MESSDEEESETSQRSKDATALAARPYQVELLKKALERNIIVCLGTGTGKTFISVMLIKELAHQVRNEFRNPHNGRRTFFLVNTVPLATQQAKVIENETDLRTKRYIGEMGVDFWDKEKWLKELKENHVLVMTAQIFLNLLSCGVLGLSDVNLLIFDECHHARKNDPYKQIMQYFDCLPKHKYPRVMGLTASVINGKVKPGRIESEIRNLEATLRSTCETSQDEEVQKYATKPTERIVPYSNESIGEMAQILVPLLQSVLEPGLAFLVECRQVNNAHWLAKFALRRCQEILESLGPWAAHQVSRYLIQDLGRGEMFHTQKEGRLFLQFSVTQLRHLRGVYENFTASDGMEVTAINSMYMSPKFMELLEILKQFGNPQVSSQHAEGTDNQLCGIVFVEQRYTALMLKEQINKISQQDPQLSFIKCGCVIGHGTGGKATYSKETEMNFKKQERILSQFRKHEFNLLIATSVVEEGLDVPKCNFVVRFDFPKNFGSYVQSKGRARAKNSVYCMLVEQQDMMEKRGELEGLGEIERVLSEICHDREAPSEEECTEAVSDDYLPPYMPVKGEGKARVTMNGSISLLCRYCSTLPGDKFTHLIPDFVTEEWGAGAFVSTVQMPINCPLREKIVGDPMPRKKLAKMAASLKACQRLHEVGELNDDLVPVRSLLDDDSDEEEEEEDEESRKRGKQGTKKRKRRYVRKVPDVFSNSLPQEGDRMWLHTIKMTSTTNDSRLGPLRRCFSNGCCKMFGILIKNQLPSVRQFKLFPDFGEVTVSLGKPLRMTNNCNLQMIRRFHRYVFSQLLRMPLEDDPEKPDGFYIVLLDDSGRRIDIEYMEQCEERAVSFEDPHNPAIEEFTRLHDAVVLPTHREVGGRRETFILSSVCKRLSPMSPFPDPSKAKTFKEYFEVIHRCKVTKLDQPLLEVEHMSLRVNVLVDRKKLKESSKKRSYRRIRLIPELCELGPLPASLLSAALMVPSILYRITSLLLAMQLRESIAVGYDISKESELPPIGAEHEEGEMYTPMTGGSGEELMEVADEKELEFHELSKVLRKLFSNNDVCHTMPESALILQAVTTAHATDIFNLERLEMLGDAFLKLAVSLYLYTTFEDKDEGKLTKRKIKQISNLALFRAAERRGLSPYVHDKQFARGMWCPPGCRVSQSYKGTAKEAAAVDAMEVDEVDDPASDDHQTTTAADRVRQECSTQCLSDKAVADSVEALIGAYLISCGYQGALSFMKYLGLQVLPEESNDNLQDLEGDGSMNDELSGNLSSPGKYAIFDLPQLIHFGTGNQDNVDQLIMGHNTFEERIQYTFKNKLYLLQALTHASYQPNRVTDCYQRLEFLGDALLDFLVTQHLYVRNKRLSPGELTDVRQALVNNNIFARIAVRYGFHKYLKYMSPGWFKKIDTFVCVLEAEEEDDETKEVSSDSFITVSEADEEGIEAPKVLGDVFESVAGAVFLDSGMDLIATWRVYYSMMKPYIDQYSKNVPLNPVRLVYENDSNAEFGKAEQLKDGKVKRTLKVSWGRFEGKGANGRIAKLTVAKLAMNDLPQRTTT